MFVNGGQYNQHHDSRRQEFRKETGYSCHIIELACRRNFFGKFLGNQGYIPHKSKKDRPFSTSVLPGLLQRCRWHENNSHKLKLRQRDLPSTVQRCSLRNGYEYLDTRSKVTHMGLFSMGNPAMLRRQV